MNRRATARAETCERNELVAGTPHPASDAGRPACDTMRKAVWADIHKDILSPADIDGFVDWCGRAGVGMAFVGVNHATGLMTYPSDLAPRAVEVEAWDPTRETVRKCRQAGLEVHAWVCVGNWGRASIAPDRLSARGPRPLQETHPDWFCTDQTGRNMLDSDAPYVFLNPAHPGVRDFHVRLCGEILSRYEFDGYHLDYIRYTFTPRRTPPGAREAFGGEGESLTVQLEGSTRLSFDEPTLRRFQQDTGLDFFGSGPDLPSRVRWLYAAEDGGARRETWYAWKAERVTELVRRLREATARQGRRLSAAVFSGYPWCGEEVAQRWPRWVDERLLDFIVPMDYGVDEAGYPGHLRSQNDALKAGPLPAVPVLSGLLGDGSFTGLPPAGVADRLRRYQEKALEHHRAGLSLYCYSLFRRMLGDLPAVRPSGAA